MLPLQLRKNMSGIIQFSTPNKKELTSLREEWTSLNHKDFNDLIRQTLIDSHDFLYIDNQSRIYRNFNLIEMDLDH